MEQFVGNNNRVWIFLLSGRTDGSGQESQAGERMAAAAGSFAAAYFSGIFWFFFKNGFMKTKAAHSWPILSVDDFIA